LRQIQKIQRDKEDTIQDKQEGAYILQRIFSEEEKILIGFNSEF